MLGPEARFPLRIDWERVQALPAWQRGGSLAGLEAPLVAFPLKSEWAILHPEAPEAFPAPQVASTEPDLAPDPPGPVLKLQRGAEGAGWAVEATYAVGFLPHSTHGRPSATAKVSWALRMSQGGRRAVAVRMGNAWSSFWYWTPECFFMRANTLAEFEEWIA